MHVHIDLAARHGQEQEHPRTRVLGHRRAVAPVGRREDPRVAEGPPVHEEVGAPEPRPCPVGTLQRTEEAHSAPLGGHGNQSRRVGILPDRGDARRQIPPRRQVEDDAPVRPEDETRVQVGQRQGVQRLGDGTRLDAGGAQETGPHGGVEKEVAHVDGGARAAGRVLDALHAARQHAQAAARGPAGGRCLDQHARHGGDRGERLAPETEGVDVAQVLGAPDLAGGVAVQTHQQVLADHAAAVVGDADAALAALFDRHRHRAGTRVQRVLDQLLHHRGRPLDDFAGRDLVRDVVRQDADARAGGV